MDFTFKPNGVCSREISLRLNGYTIEDCSFTGGCSGNTQGIAALIKGTDAREMIPRLKGIRCGFKKTSCPDQLALALEEALKQQKKNA